MADAASDHALLPIHRSEALTDGIYAVAMTLLVIELKIPEAQAIRSSAALAEALAAIAPKAMAWIISFLVLALFWLAHHRVFATIRRADARLVRLNLLQLAFVSLMPFSSAVVGEHGVLLAQAIYSLNMVALGVCALLIVQHVHRRPDLGAATMSKARYDGARIRIGGLIVCSVAAVVLAAFVPWSGAGNVAFVLMAVISPLSRVAEERLLRADADAVADGADGARSRSAT